MCRLFYDPSPQTRGVNLIEEQLAALEESFGGDGNGMVLLGSGRRPIKGVKVRPRELAEAAVDFKGPVMFHTRKASMGGVVDELCQPFYIPHNTVIAHNGHWGEWGVALDTLLKAGKIHFIPNRLSDSLVGALLARSYGLGAISNYIDEGVWLYADVPSARDIREGAKQEPKQVVVVNHSGGFCVNFTTGQAASEPVFWSEKDDVQWLARGSILQLFPEIKLLKGTTWVPSPKKQKGTAKKGKGKK